MRSEKRMWNRVRMFMVDCEAIFSDKSAWFRRFEKNGAILYCSVERFTRNGVERADVGMRGGLGIWCVRSFLIAMRYCS